MTVRPHPALRPSAVMRAFAPRLRSRLSSFGDCRDGLLPILTEAQRERSLRFAEMLAASSPPDQQKRVERNRRRPREAAVLVPLCTVASVPSVLLTIRSDNVSMHKGQISFPGGHVDVDDESLEGTALRETKEELVGDHGEAAAGAQAGFDWEGGVAILGRTGTVPALTGATVTPIVGAIVPDLPSYESIPFIFPGNEGEVDRVFAVPVRDLFENETSEPLPRLGGREEAMGPVFPTDHGKVWGLTAMILRPILHRVLKKEGFYDAEPVSGQASRRHGGEEDEERRRSML